VSYEYYKQGEYGKMPPDEDPRVFEKIQHLPATFAAPWLEMSVATRRLIISDGDFLSMPRADFFEHALSEQIRASMNGEGPEDTTELLWRHEMQIMNFYTGPEREGLLRIVREKRRALTE